MMEVGPWRWDGKSEHDFYVKEGGWEEYTTMVFGESMNILRDVAFLTSTQWISQRVLDFHTQVQTNTFTLWTL
jgi:hypothetical protein